ncbi:unnamed protein product, partial [Chrysoparadoxa australica]
AGYPGNVADALGEPVLNIAAASKDFERALPIVKALVEGGASTSLTSFSGGETSLMKACVAGNAGVVRYLVEEAKADINATNNRGDTALHIAGFWGHIEIVKFLLAAGANVMIRNIEHKLPGQDFDEIFPK